CGGKPGRSVSHCRGGTGADAIALKVAIGDEVDSGAEGDGRIRVNDGDGLAARRAVAARVRGMKGSGDTLGAGAVGNPGGWAYADLVVAAGGGREGGIEIPRAAALDGLGGAAS